MFLPRSGLLEQIVRAHSAAALPSKLGSLLPNRSTRRYAQKL